MGFSLNKTDTDTDTEIQTEQEGHRKATGRLQEAAGFSPKTQDGGGEN